MEVIKEVLEYNNIQDAEQASQVLNQYCIDNVEGYNAETYSSVLEYENKYYLYLDERVIGHDFYNNKIEKTFTIEVPEI